MDLRSLTLRRKDKPSRRPHISAPKQIISDSNSTTSPVTSAAAPSTITPGQVVERKHKHKGAISDIVKKRYSTRFHQPVEYDSLKQPPVPAIPRAPSPLTSAAAGTAGASPLPTTTAAAARDIAPPEPGKPVPIDLSALRDPKLAPDKCSDSPNLHVATILANASDKDIQEYQVNLAKLKNRTNADLQHNVHRNRNQFMKISKEAEKLKEEMTTLRGLMSDLTVSLGQTNATANTPALGTSFDDISAPLLGSVSNKRGNRSSVANLESMWTQQLQSLWKTIERSQKFLPAIPGRHVIYETSQWVELDAATWKPRRPVHIVLLNDHVLVAVKKRKRVDPNNPPKGPAPTKLVAEQCWPLQEIEMIDLSGEDRAPHEKGLSNAINIHFGNKSFTYRADPRSTTAKAELLIQYRRTLEDLRKLLRIETQTSIQKSQEKRASRPLSMAVVPELIEQAPPIPALTGSVIGGGAAGAGTGIDGNKFDIIIDVNGKIENMRWVDTQLDDLDIYIALQDFESAVSSVERLRRLTREGRGSEMVKDVIFAKVDQRANVLADMIVRALVDTHSWLGPTRTNISWLTRLGYDDRAREAVLGARTDIINKRFRQCVFEGDLKLYIFQISFVYFTLIKNTIATYQQCFPPPSTSAVIKWAKDRVDEFNTILSRQLSSLEKDGVVWNACVDIVMEQCAILNRVGVDFTELVERALQDMQVV
ncbi:exocyst complex component exo84 [Ascosphaera pollenicola]|nr:exocyst complex component exo84 [Ascosphaera pollenicola]